MRHYSEFESFSEALVGFVQDIRHQGYGAGLQMSQDTAHAALAGLMMDKDQLEYALASLFCTSQEERKRFTPLFKRFWRRRGTRISDTRTYKNQKKIAKKATSAAVMTGVNEKSEKNQSNSEAKTTAGASVSEVARKTDFSKLSITESKELELLSEKLIQELALRLKRRQKKSKKGTINIAQSIRRNIQRGGDIFELSRRNKKKDKFRLLMLLDVSGSMDKYSYYLMKFIWLLRSNFKQVEVFTFSAKLERITEYLSQKDVQTAFRMLSFGNQNWSSGTKIGACLQTFNSKYAKEYLNGRTITIVLSDGLDTGEPTVLADAMKKIKLRSKKVVWLNPLKGMKSYQPIQRGMQAAMPAIEHFGSAHNFDSLLELENILIDA